MTTVVSIENFQDSVSFPECGVNTSGSVDCELSNGRILRVQWGEPFQGSDFGVAGVSLDGSECLEVFDASEAPEGATASSWVGCLEYPALASEAERAAMEQAIDDERDNVDGGEE